MNELMKKFDELYAKLEKSTNVEDMHLFGRVLREAMEWLSSNRPDKAEELLEKLCAINWDNYVTKKESEEIVKAMTPQPKWTYEQVMRGLNSLGLPIEETPYYNSHALYVAVSMKYSDSAKTIAERLMGQPLESVDDTQMLEYCYYLALDVLKDRDGVFNIRQYFGLH